VEFRRNFSIFFIFAIQWEKKFRYFSVYFVLKFKNSKKFVKKSEWLKPTALGFLSAFPVKKWMRVDLRKPRILYKNSPPFFNNHEYFARALARPWSL